MRCLLGREGMSERGKGQCLVGGRGSKEGEEIELGEREGERECKV